MKTKFTLSIISFLFAGGLSAQMVPVAGGNEAFLQGLYSEVGVSRCGVYGALSIPAGYHQNTAALGFVADHEMDGWTTSSPGQPVRCGDYFYPGSPYEAWGVQVDGVLYGNWNAAGSCDGSVGGGIPGDVTYYNGSGGFKAGLWEGDIISGSTNLHICQYTAVPDSQLYFSTTITIKNNGLAPVNNVYYLRHVDPDNEQPYSGSFNTNNVVDANPAVGSLAHVSATGFSYGCYLGILATGYPDARAFIGGSVGVFPAAISDCWSGVGGYNVTVGATNGGADDCMGIANRWATIPGGASVVFTFYYVLDPSAINAAINSASDVLVYINGNLALSQAVGGGGPAVGGCAIASSETDTVNFRGYFCSGESTEVNIDAPSEYHWTWVAHPDVSVLSANGDSVIITPGSGVDSVTYQVDGQYILGVDTINTVLLVTLIEEDPIADFSYDLSCIDMPTCFEDQSTSNGGSNIESYLWNFDEVPLISHAQDTCVLLDEYRIHNVQLIIQTAWGCKDTVIKPVEVFDSIAANFTYNAACEDSLSSFFDATIYGDTNLVAWTWNFGTVPPSGSNVQNPTHTYGNDGSYLVSLIVENAIGCKDTIVQQVSVYPSPDVDFIADLLYGCSPLNVQFTDLTTNDTVDLVTWHWTFGDGDTSSMQNPDHTYPQGNNSTPTYYNVTLTVTNEYGCQATLTQPNYIGVAPTPDAAFSYTIVDPEHIIDNPIPFLDESEDNITNWQWYFGDGDSTNTQSPTHTYHTPDSFVVTLIVQNADGCMDTVSHVVIVIPPDLILPNILTPNGDGHNDALEFDYLPWYGTSHLTVFNRWGTAVYDNTDYKNDWVPQGLVDGTYFYIIHVSSLDKDYTSTLNIFNNP